MLPDPGTNSHRKLIVELAAPYQLPAIHALRAATVDGALMSYGVDLLHARATSGTRLSLGPATTPSEPICQQGQMIAIMKARIFSEGKSLSRQMKRKPSCLIS